MNSIFRLPKEGGLITSAVPRDIIHRYEKIPTSVFTNEEEGVAYVANKVVAAINKHDETYSSREIFDDSQPFVLGLTTGRTAIGLYRELVARHKAGEVSFANVVVFSLDEFYPIPAEDIRSRT